MKVIRPVLIAVSLALTGPALAQHTARTVTFSIEKKRLPEALAQWAQATGLQVISQAEVVRQLTANPVIGSYTPMQALQLLLADTQLTFEMVGERMVAIEPIRQNAANSTAVPLQRLAAVTPASGSSTAASSAKSDAGRVVQEEVIVTAQKRSESLQEVPIAISVMSGEDLDRSTVQGVSEALNSVPGIATSETYLGSGTNIAIRGVGASFPLFTGPSAVAYYLDSVPFGLVKSAIGPDAGAYDLERVEVLRGPQGTLYGSSALNGVVRILTADPDLTEFSAKARVSGSGTQGGGSNYRANVMFNAPIIEDRLGARATIGYQRDSGWIDRPNASDVNDSNIATYRLKLEGRPSDDLTIGLFAWRHRSDADAPNLGYTFDRSSSLLDQPTSTDYDATGLKLEYETPWFSISSMTSHLEYENVGRLGLDVPGFGVPDAQYFSRLQSKVGSQEINLTSSLEGNWRWSAGGMYRRGTEDLVQSFTVLPVPAIHYVNKSESYAVYGEVTRLLLDQRLELTAGLRYFHDRLPQRGQTAPDTPFQYAQSTAHATTPRALVTWHASDRLMLYTSYSQGFRSGFPQTPTVLQVLPEFPAVEPDRLTNYEVGMKGSAFDGLLVFETAIYHMDWEDIQLLLATPIDGLPYPGVVNGARARGNGIDVDLTLRLASGLNISPYVSWNDLEMSSDVVSGGDVLYSKDDRPSGSPKTTAGISADYSFPLGASGATASISAGANYISELAYRTITTPGEPVLIQESDRILTSRASVSVEFDRWTAMLFGDNLSNERGATAVMFPGVVPDWQSRLRPRTIGLQVEYRMR